MPVSLCLKRMPEIFLLKSPISHEREVENQMIELAENIPLDTTMISKLISDRNDLFLVWPKAKYPFDHHQWAEMLNPENGHKSFLIYKQKKLVGHSALLLTDSPHTYRISFLYLSPQHRSQGLGRKTVVCLENYAFRKLEAEKLTLVVRDYNPIAYQLYIKCGFKEYGHKGSLLQMAKDITDKGGD